MIFLLLIFCQYIIKFSAQVGAPSLIPSCTTTDNIAVKRARRCTIGLTERSVTAVRYSGTVSVVKARTLLSVPLLMATAAYVSQ